MPRKPKTDPPAKKETKASLIRAYNADFPSEGPTAIAKALTAQGVPVSAAMVSTTLSNSAKRSGKAGKRKGRPAKAANPYANLIDAKRFVENVGGIEKGIKSGVQFDLVTVEACSARTPEYSEWVLPSNIAGFAYIRANSQFINIPYADVLRDNRSSSYSARVLRHLPEKFVVHRRRTILETAKWWALNAIWFLPLVLWIGWTCRWAVRKFNQSPNSKRVVAPISVDPQTAIATSKE